MLPAEHRHSRTGPDAELYPESATVDATLSTWRRKASDFLLAAVAAAHLPVVVLGWLGHGPPMGPMAKCLGLGIYVVVAAAALLRRIDYRRRLLASFFVIYVGLIVTNLYFPNGPYAKSVITIPVFVLVLLGPRAARTAIVASTGIIFFIPLLCAQPGLVGALGIDPAEVAAPTGLVWFRIIVMAASLFALMLVLDRFHRFLLDTLSQRIQAQRKIEDDIRERQEFEREIAASSDRERRRLGQELHDGVCQQITAALLRCQALERRIGKGGALSATDFEILSSLLAETIDDAHNVARGLCPLEPEPDALAPALRSLTKQMQGLAAVHCEFISVGDVRVSDPEAAQHLYRIAQEALSNAVQHANASHITVALRGNHSELILQVKDDGVGLLPASPNGGMGLRTMTYRARVLGGELAVTSAPGSGTCVTCRTPLSAAALAPVHQL